MTVICRTAEQVVTVPPSREERAIATLTRAFSTDPANRWSWPDYQQYLATFPAFVRALGGQAFTSGTAYAVGSFAGVALWLPPGVHPDEDGLVALFERTTSCEVRDALFLMFEQLAAAHPQEPHWYLPLIGVDPGQQHRGYGSRLLRHILAICDRDGVPAYLESSNPANIPFYERHGFDVVHTIQVGTSPTITPMLRRPR